MDSEAGKRRVVDTQEYNNTDEGFDPDFFQAQFKEPTMNFIPEDTEDLYTKNLLFDLNSLCSNPLSTVTKRDTKEFSFVANTFESQEFVDKSCTEITPLADSKVNVVQRVGTPINQKIMRDSIGNPMQAISEVSSSCETHNKTAKRSFKDFSAYYDPPDLTEKSDMINSKTNLKAKVEEIKNAQRSKTCNEQPKKVMPTPSRKANSTIPNTKEQRSNQHELIKSQVFPKHIEARTKIKREILKEANTVKEYCAITKPKLKWIEEETEKYIKLIREHEDVVKDAKELLYDQVCKCQDILEPIAIMFNSFINNINPKDFS